jgi:hypothetical protein
MTVNPHFSTTLLMETTLYRQNVVELPKSSAKGSHFNKKKNQSKQYFIKESRFNKLTQKEEFPYKGFVSSGKV